MTISVCIATYGDEKWKRLALRAVRSAEEQGAHEIIVEHQPDGDVATSRNAAAERASGTHLLFLDGDDELALGYVEAMQLSIETFDDKSMFTPAVSYIVRGKAAAPKFWPEQDLRDGNWMVIGTVVPRDLFLRIGGFRPLLHAYEDWDLFARMWREGAQTQKVPGAVYRAHVMHGSRNKRMTNEERVQVHYDIGRDLFPERYPPEWLDRHMRNARRANRQRSRS